MEPHHHFISKHTVFVFSILCNLLFPHVIYTQKLTINSSNGERISLKPSETFAVTVEEKGKLKSLSTIDQNEILNLIVTFKSPPLCLQKSGSLAKATDLKAEHVMFKSEMEKLISSLQKTNAAQLTYKIHREFYHAFNGVSLNCTRSMMNYIQSMSMVKAIHENLAVKAYLDSSVAQIKADKVHNELGLTGKGILVGVIDTGIDYLNPALGGGFGPGFRVIGGYDFYNNDNDPMDDNSHGTHVAGIIGANSDSLQGVAPDVSFIAVKVLDQDGSGYIDDVIAGIEYCLDPDGNPATDDAVNIINMSLGGAPVSDNPLDEAVNNATEAGILSVAGAGNSGKQDVFNSGFETIGSPGTAITALTVGACDKQFNMADFSSKGPDPINLQIKPEIVAPGVNIKSTVLNNNTARYSGTSMATPHVAGAAALLMQQHLEWTPNQIKWALVNSTQPLKVTEFNPYQHGNGCVDCWEASKTDVIIEPGVLSFGVVDLSLDEWRDTLNFTFQNLSVESKTYSISRTDNLPDEVQIIFSQSNVTIPPQSTVAVSAIIVVPSSVPILNDDPFAYKGKVLCTSEDDTVTVPFGFVKANLLTVECDIAPLLISLWDPNGIAYEYILGEPGKKKYNFRYRAGTFNLFCAFQEYGHYYAVEKHNVTIQGPSFISVDHTEAAFNCFSGTHYDKNDQVLNRSNIIPNTPLVYLYRERSQGDNAIIVTNFFISSSVSISQFDTTNLISQYLAYNQNNKVTALTGSTKGIKTQDDLIIPSGSANLSDINVLCKKPDDVLAQEQSLGFTTYSFIEGGFTEKTYDLVEFQSDSVPKISMSKDPNFNEELALTNDQLNTITVHMERTYSGKSPQEFKMGDIAFGQDDGVILFERSDREHDKYTVKSRFAPDDTLVFAPGEDMFLQTTNHIIYNPGSYFYFSPKEGTIPFLSGGIVSPLAECYDAVPSLNHWPTKYEIFNNGYSLKSEMASGISLNNFPQLYSTFVITQTSDPYSLLEQSGFSNIEYDLDLRNAEPWHWADEKLFTPPIVDHLITLVGEKHLRRIAPAQDGIIQIYTYDKSSDLKDITVYAVPSSGEEIKLNLETLKEKREYIAHIPDNLPHEFIDVIVRLEDDIGDKTTFTAAPAFFFGESDEIVYDSRVWMSNYQIQNHEDFPFAAGDTLLYTINYVNKGNINADSIYVKFPTTQMFIPVGSDSISFSIKDTASVELKLVMLQDHKSEAHIIYSPELHWASNGKSYMRRHPVRIKTWEEILTSVDENSINRLLTYQLMNNFPNPFNPTTTISFQIPKQEYVTMIVYDILGRQVSELTNGLYNAGTHQIRWDGKNQHGQAVSSGLYIYRINAGNFVQSKKMLLLR